MIITLTLLLCLALIIIYIQDTRILMLKASNEKNIKEARQARLFRGCLNDTIILLNKATLEIKKLKDLNA